LKSDFLIFLGFGVLRERLGGLGNFFRYCDVSECQKISLDDWRERTPRFSMLNGSKD
jgi:hypothetical protein